MSQRGLLDTWEVVPRGGQDPCPKSQTNQKKKEKNPKNRIQLLSSTFQLLPCYRACVLQLPRWVFFLNPHFPSFRNVQILNKGARLKLKKIKKSWSFDHLRKMNIFCLTVTKRFLRGVQHVVQGLEQRIVFIWPQTIMTKTRNIATHEVIKTEQHRRCTWGNDNA